MKYWIAFALVCWKLTAIEAQTLTVEEAIALALEKNPTAQASAMETSRLLTLKKALDIPKTDITLLYGQYNSFAKNDNNITITQSIPFPTVLSRQYKVSRELVTASRLKENITRNELTFQVKHIFNHLLYLKARKKTLIQQDSLIASLLKFADLQYKTGESTLLAKTSAETQRMEIANLVNRNDADIQIALDQLQFLCQSTLEDIHGDLTKTEIIPPLDSLRPEQNPSLAFATHQVKVADEQKKLEAAHTLPDIHVGYFSQTLIGVQNIDGQDRYFGPGKRFQGFQVGLSLPLWVVPYHARAKAASVAKTVSEKQALAQQITLLQQYNQVMQELNKNGNSLKYYRTSALTTADLLKQHSNIAFKNGELDHTTLLLNLRSALNIYEGYLLTLYEYNQNLITLQFLTGNK